MNIKLVWVNRNVKPVTTKVYRLAAPGDPLVTPLVTLTNNEVTYTDTTALAGKTYYYVLSVNDTVNTLNTVPVKVVATYNTGPGPTYLQWGNLQYGYYGTVGYADMFTRSEFLAAVGLTEATFGTAVALPVWDKWARNGKTYFVPRTSMGLYPAALVYNAGIMFGVSGAGFYIPQNGVSTPQNKTITKNGFVYTPMCPSGSNETLYPDVIAAGTDPLLVRAGSMAADFYYPTHSEVISPLQRMPRLLNSVTVNSSFGATIALTQQRVGQNILGIIGNTAIAVGSTGTLEQLTTIGQSANGSYRPVLRFEATTVQLG